MRGDPVAYRLVSDCVSVYSQHDNSRTVKDIITKFSGNHTMVKTEAKFEDGNIGVHGLI